MLPQQRQLIKNMLAGDVRALSRLITLVENDGNAVAGVMQEVCQYQGNSYCIGITGPPGAGKSTTVGNITSLIREKGLSVGILCADPSSPFSGGAILGDRIRMQKHYLDDGVFIRSMSTRGSHGGLPRSTVNVIKLLGASKKDYVIVETVGVGQTELDIMKSADTTVVVLTPESGDSIQALKAGLLEVADIFVVNKSDRPGADDMASLLSNMIQHKISTGIWTVPVVKTEAQDNVGTDILFKTILQHRQVLEESGLLAQQRQMHRRQEFLAVLEERIRAEFLELVNHNPDFREYINQVECGETDPYSATEALMRSVKYQKKSTG